jgi:hypothetical protein
MSDTSEPVAGRPTPARLQRLAPPREVAGQLAERDEAYIREHYVSLDEAMAGRPETAEGVRRLVAARRLPQPAYVLDDGTEMVPPDYFGLVDEAGGIDQLEAHFKRRYDEALRFVGKAADDRTVHQGWKDFLGGGYSVCLWRVTPENIVTKDHLVESLEALLAQPRPQDGEWRRAVREQVAALDDLERPFAPLDDARWEYRSSRDRLIEEPRERYPWLFQPAPSESGGGAI